MDALRIIMIIVASFVALADQATAVTADTEPPESGSSAEADTASTQALTTSPAPLPAPRNCATSRGLPGACSSRQLCDYSTGSIDHTLYAPRGYVSSCLKDEVCCPFHALVTEPPHVANNNEDDIFDDDNF